MELREKSAQYRAQLEGMCKALARSGLVRQMAPELGIGAGQLFDALAAYRRTGRSGFRLALEPNWAVNLVPRGLCGVDGDTELHFGGEISFEDGCLERQVLTVVILLRPDEESEPVVGRPGLVADENYVVRRFHFDFDRGVAGGSTPLGHLQVGGQLKEASLSPGGGGSLRYEVFDQLDCPRLPWPVTGLPIIIDTFLRQFESGLEGLIGETAWKKCVMDSERLWLADYYRRAAEMMAGTGNRQCLYDYLCDETAYWRDDSVG